MRSCMFGLDAAAAAKHSMEPCKCGLSNGTAFTAHSHVDNASKPCNMTAARSYSGDHHKSKFLHFAITLLGWQGVSSMVHMILYHISYVLMLLRCAASFVPVSVFRVRYRHQLFSGALI